MKLERPLGVADTVVAPSLMISIPHTPLQGATSIVLALYVGAFLGQALCVLHTSHVESLMGSGIDGSAAHASSSTETHASSTMATHASPRTATYVSSSMAAHSPSQHGEHSGAPGPNHAGMCAVTACGSAVTTTPDDGFGPLSRFSGSRVAYLGGRMPPDGEMVPPPPRLG